MNRSAVLGCIGVLALVAPLACQGPDKYLRPIDANGIGGHSGGGLGGTVILGQGGSPGLGGFKGAGGAPGLGGFSGTGGRGAGGFTPGAGGRSAGGTTGSAGGTTGIAGMNGAGGRMFDAGTNCVTAMIAAGYSAGTATPCSACMENGMSKTATCMAIIDCIAPMYPCGTMCVTECQNRNSGSGPVNGCVNALMMAACGTN